MLIVMLSAVIFKILCVIHFVVLLIMSVFLLNIWMLLISFVCNSQILIHPQNDKIFITLLLFLNIELPYSNGYLYVEANGGLNQQRTSVSSYYFSWKFKLGHARIHLQYICILVKFDTYSSIFYFGVWSFYVPFLQICNAVAVAGYLNATLVIPNFHFHSIWKDPRLVKIYTCLFIYFNHCTLINSNNKKTIMYSPCYCQK